MFKIKSKSVAHNFEEGVLIEQFGKYRYIYETADERLLIIFTESGIRKNGQYVETITLPKLLKWEPPDREFIDEAQREKIKHHLIEAVLLINGQDSQVYFEERE